MNDHKTSTPTLVSALRILAGEIQSADGVANMAIAEGADRIEELVCEIERWRTATAKLRDAAEEASRVANEQAARAAAIEKDLERSNTSLIASNTTLRMERNKARESLKLREADVARQWTVNAELKAELAELREKLEMQTTRCIDREERLEQAEACILDREKQIVELRRDRARLSGGVELIADERARQISVEGCTPEHDDKHADGRLLDSREHNEFPEVRHD